MTRALSYTGYGWAILVGLVLALSVLYAYGESNPQIELAKANRARFANVVVLLDGTRSISDLNFEYAKQVAAKGIVPHIGVSDELTLHSIGPEFGLSNVISGATFEEQPPQVLETRAREILGLLGQAREGNSAGRIRSQLYSLAGEQLSLSIRLDARHRKWQAQIAGLGRPAPGGTNLTCAMEAIDAYFRASVKQFRESYLFVISDLIQEGSGHVCGSGPGDDVAFRGVHITLIYPHDSTQGHDWNRILDSWRRYFGDNHVAVYPLAAALNMENILSPNPMAGLEQYSIHPFGSNLAALLPLILRVSLVGVLPYAACVAMALFARWRRVAGRPASSRS